MLHVFCMALFFVFSTSEYFLLLTIIIKSSPDINRLRPRMTKVINVFAVQCHVPSFSPVVNAFSCYAVSSSCTVIFTAKNTTKPFQQTQFSQCQCVSAKQNTTHLCFRVSLRNEVYNSKGTNIATKQFQFYACARQTYMYVLVQANKTIKRLFFEVHFRYFSAKFFTQLCTLRESSISTEAIVLATKIVAAFYNKGLKRTLKLLIWQKYRTPLSFLPTHSVYWCRAMGSGAADVAMALPLFSSPVPVWIITVGNRLFTEQEWLMADS